MWLLYLMKAVPQTLHSKIGSYTPFILPFEASGNVIYLILLAAPSYQYVFTGDFLPADSPYVTVLVFFAGGLRCSVLG